ncbi:MAG: VOC family protein [Anaerovoracaceae bacterium]|jgi:lactoylglutathione lyase
MFTFNHFNFNVLDLERSLKFYDEALGLKPVRRNDQPEFTIVFLGDGKSDFELELTWMKDRSEPYDLGEIEYHLAFTTDDMESAFQHHTKMGCVCFENKAMGVYFIEDPDGYWIEILPPRE